MVRLVTLLVLLLHEALAHNYTVEEIYNWTIPKDILTNYPCYLCGYDRVGSPIWYAPIGRWNLGAIVKEGPERVDLYKKHMILLFQRVVDSGMNSSQGSIGVIDMEGFTARNTNSGTLLVYIWGFREVGYYAKNKFLKLGLIINVNVLFQRIFKSLSHHLGDLEKHMEIYGTNADVWKARMLKLAAANQLPEVLGGNEEFKPIETYG